MQADVVRNKAKPYIGVTGYTSLAQANAVAEAVSAMPGDRVLMDGYLVAPQSVSSRWKSQEQRYEKYAARFISRNAALEVFKAPRTGSLRIVHFCSDIDTELDEQLQDVFDCFGPGVDGFQINWPARPNPSEVGAFKKSADLVRIENDLEPLVMVIQLHSDVIATTSGDLAGLVAYVNSYVEAEAVTHVLYDPSGGQGVEFDQHEPLS